MPLRVPDHGLEPAGETSPLLSSGSPVENETAINHIPDEDSVKVDRQISQTDDVSKKDLEYHLLTASGSHIIVKSGEIPIEVLGATTT